MHRWLGSALWRGPGHPVTRTPVLGPANALRNPASPCLLLLRGFQRWGPQMLCGVRRRPGHPVMRIPALGPADALPSPASPCLLLPRGFPRWGPQMLCGVPRLLACSSLGFPRWGPQMLCGVPRLPACSCLAVFRVGARRRSADQSRPDSVPGTVVGRKALGTKLAHTVFLEPRWGTKPGQALLRTRSCRKRCKESFGDQTCPHSVPETAL